MQFRAGRVTQQAVFKTGYDSPVGRLCITANATHVLQLDWARGPVGPGQSTPVLDAAQAQLDEYFQGQRTVFDVPFGGYSSNFAQRFAAAMCAIPFGETRTYGDLAHDMGVSAQAIGQACGANRIPILIPCHRVLAASGLGGYSGRGGIETKVWLLRHEGAGGLLI